MRRRRKRRKNVYPARGDDIGKSSKVGGKSRTTPR